MHECLLGLTRAFFQATRGAMRLLFAAAMVALASAESKDCDPKKDSGCNKFIRPFYPHECWAAYPGGITAHRIDAASR